MAKDEKQVAIAGIRVVAGTTEGSGVHIHWSEGEGDDGKYMPVIPVICGDSPTFTHIDMKFVRLPKVMGKLDATRWLLEQSELTKTKPVRDFLQAIVNRADEADAKALERAEKAAQRKEAKATQPTRTGKKGKKLLENLEDVAARS